MNKHETDNTLIDANAWLAHLNRLTDGLNVAALRGDFEHAPHNTRVWLLEMILWQPGKPEPRL